jgi:hypothetical protein
MRKLAIWLGMSMSMLIPLIRRAGRQVGKSGVAMSYIHVEWMGYAFSLVLGVSDLGAEYAQHARKLMGED